ncbi:MAG: type II toxin-antitoxin system HicB family antitoxin [Bacillota bacterium]|nr:type II toxin-antitoxin system HicB family antitoxin [Thermoanaerobacteraceae bacterium]
MRLTGYRFLVVIEKADGNYSAYSPDLPGCVATGATPEETKQRMAEAIALHIQGLREDGLAVPEPSASADYVSVNF